MKETINKLLETRRAERETMRAALLASNVLEERTEYDETINKIDAEIRELENVLEELDKPIEETKVDVRALDVLGGKEVEKMAVENRTIDKFDTAEYRDAFMNFCKYGTPVPAEFRGDAVTKTNDASAVIPTTILQEIIKEVKSYGNLYAKVRKLNVQGGMQVPILSLKPTATWITADTATSESDKHKLEAKTYVSFGYFGLECKVAQTLLTNIVTFDMFQELFVTLAVEAIAKALDVAIMNGSGSGEMLGITKDERVTNVVTLSADAFESWSGWKKNVFAAMPKSYRDGEFFMAQSTFDGYIDGMVDDNGQPIARVNYGIDGAENYRFGGKTVETVEDDIITPYDDAESGDIVAVFAKLSDYAVNTNMEMRVERWEDKHTHEIINNAILIADGKLLDPHGVIIVKKA